MCNNKNFPLIFSLRDALIGYMDACPYEEDSVIDETLMMIIEQFPSDKDDPNRVLTAFSVDVWSLAQKILTKKQKQSH